MQKAISVVETYSDEQLTSVWGAIQASYRLQHDPGPYDCETFDDWAHLISEEMINRGIDKGF